MSYKNFSLTLLLTLSFFFPHAINSLFFNISSFDHVSKSLIELQGDAFINGGTIKLTKDSMDSAGRALYKQEVILWDEKSGELTDFTTHFSFIIKCVNTNRTRCGDGLTFFLAKHTATFPKEAGGGLLALLPPVIDFSSPDNAVVAVEFDTYKNYWDPSSDHVGIDVSNIISSANVSLHSSMKDGRTAYARVAYHSATKNLTVFLTYDKHQAYKGKSILSYNVDLRDVLPSKVAIGFSATTGRWYESHEILSWSLSSTLEGKTDQDPNNPTAPAESPRKAREEAEAPVKAESPMKAESPRKAPEEAEAPVKAESPDQAGRSPEISQSPDNTKKPEIGDNFENSENADKGNVGLMIVGLSASIGAILMFL